MFDALAEGIAELQERRGNWVGWLALASIPLAALAIFTAIVVISGWDAHKQTLIQYLAEQVKEAWFYIRRIG